MRQISFAVVGADFLNKRGPTRRFEIATCAPGDPVDLQHEPKNPADGNAIMVMSERGVCMGYVSADRTTIIHHAWRDAKEVNAIFQRKSDFGAWIRVGFDCDPELTAEKIDPPQDEAESRCDPDSGFWPDEVYPDE